MDIVSYLKAEVTVFQGVDLSLYKQYTEERTDKFVLETDKGFALYSFPDEKTVYIEDIYTSPDNRFRHTATDLANEISSLAKSKGCTRMLGSVIPTAKNSTESLKVLLAYGMELNSSTNNFILFSKDIE